MSKCHQVIERFSEDIDLVVLQNENETGNQLKKKIKTIGKCVEEIMPEIEVKGITNKMGMIRKTVHQHNKLFNGNFGQVKDFIILESSWFGSFEPYTTKQVRSYVYEMMLANQQQELINEYNLNPFDVNVLTIERTMCEKIMSLVRFSHTKKPIENLNNKIRHVYDLCLLLKNEKIQKYFNSMAFEAMLNKVAEDDKKSFKSNSDWLSVHPKEALIFKDVENTWKQLSNTYFTTFRSLVYGEFPGEKAIVKCLSVISKRLKEIKKWDL